ncbi:hypothetical protein [Myxosarcina sp. GI1]|uniref:hypothetical protein n=1 Tax=Myxosarcina sp. GI1 TaxID=1541065 RepID=UPI0012E06924|nr:hypothetical protein [Myxosarcina sp. GI1]
MPNHLPNFASLSGLNDPLLPHKSITLTEAFKSKIEFVFDKDNVCFEVGKIIKPHIMVKIPGTKKYEERKLHEFERVQIGKTIYYLEK